MTTEEWNDTHGKPVTINSNTLENIYNYLWFKSHNPEDAYEWREVCGLMLAIDEEDEDAAELRKVWQRKWYAQQDKRVDVQTTDIITNLEDYDFHLD